MSSSPWRAHRLQAYGSNDVLRLRGARTVPLGGRRSEDLVERGHKVRRTLSIVGAIVFAFLVGMTNASPAAPARGSIMIVHGLPGFTADIYLDGELLLDGFEPTSTAGPLRIAPGSYQVDIREVGASADSPPVLSAVLPVSAGSNISILAHLTRVGDPTLSVFRNSFERLPVGRSLLQVRHGAAAPTLSVRLDDRRVKEGLRQGREWGIATDPGRHMIAFESETSDDVLISPTDIRLEEGVAQIVYVIGSAEGDSLDLMLQSVRGLRSTPSGVLTGDGGLGAVPGFPTWAIAVMVASGATLFVCTRQLLRRAQGR